MAIENEVKKKEIFNKKKLEHIRRYHDKRKIDDD